MNSPYVIRMIPEPGDADREIPVNETFHEQTDDELTEKEIKQVEADDQAIQTILLGLPEDIYAAVDSCETAQEIWLRVQQMKKGSDIGIQEKKAKLFNEWERFTSMDGESTESYYHHFSKLMNDFKRNKHLPENIAKAAYKQTKSCRGLKYLTMLTSLSFIGVKVIEQLMAWSGTDLKMAKTYNRKEVDDLRAERLVKTHDPLALMANSNNPLNYLVFHPDQPSSSTYMQQPQPNNNYNPQPSFNQNYMPQPMPNLEDITDPTTAMNMALILMAKAFKLNYSTPTNNNQRISSNPRNRQIAQSVQNPGVHNVGNHNRLIVIPGIANQNPNGNGNVVAAQAKGNANRNNGNQIRCYNCRGLGHLARNCIVKPRRRDAAYLQTQLLIAQKEEAGIQLQVEDKHRHRVLRLIKLPSMTQTDQLRYNSMTIAIMMRYLVCLLKRSSILSYYIPEPHQVQQNDSNVIFEVTNVEQEGGTVEQHPTIVEETLAYFESLYNNLEIEVEKVNMVNHKLRETNDNLTTKLARYKNQEKCFEISQEKYDKFERCYQKSVYQEQCLTKKINALHLSSGKQITTLNEEISNLNNQLSKEKSTVSSLQEEKKKLKSDFKIREDELLDKQI
ncbi:retrovirus-related pol polyprotein from transposon TNT 1-94 [Tanacetum coccineum]|uniref:Retrovirus-related pol polyprotein from transposon TNT 1-94 n=1 Tax=Tanacetum coccineum TaxID=301880 RepID=A0ABQ4ZZI6_9ASTR